MRTLVILVVSAVLAASCFAQAQQTAPFVPPRVVRRPAGPQPTLALQPGNLPQTHHRLTFRDRRRLGLTFSEVHKALSEMQNAGELEGTDASVLAVEVMERLAVEKPQEWSDLPADWQEFLETVLAWLEKIIPFILKIIALFSDALPVDGAAGLCQASPVAHPFCCT